MAALPPSDRATDRDRGLDLVRSVTVMATLGGIGLTVAFAVIAADSFAGRNTAAAQTGPTTTVPGTQVNPPVGGDDQQPQAPPVDGFGNTNQPPAVVSGGS